MCHFVAREDELLHLDFFTSSYPCFYKRGLIIIKLPNGYGSVFKMSGNRRKPYRVRKMTGRTDEGKPIYINIGYTKTRAEGMLLLASYNVKPWDTQNENITLKEVYDRQLKEDKKEYSEKTINSRASVFKLASSIHNAPIKQLKTTHIQDMFESIDASIGTKRMLKSIINKIFKYALQNDIVEKNYASFVTIDFNNQEESTRKPFTKEEILHLWKIENSVRHDMVKVLLFTGFRIGELIDIKIENVDLDKKILIGGSKTKAGKNRIVPISRHIEPIIRKYYDTKNTHLFNHLGKPVIYSSYSKWWNRDEFLKPHVIHDTRHTFVSLYTETNADRIVLKRIVGHSSNDVTESVYTHTSVDILTREMNKFDDHFDSLFCV